LKIENRLYPRFVPILGLSTCLALLAIVFVVSPIAWVTGIAFLTAGAVIYLLRKVRRKREQK